MQMTKSWFLSIGLPVLIYLFSLAYALFHAFRRNRVRPMRSAQIYWFVCAAVIALGTVITVDIARRSADAVALASRGMLITGVGILGALAGFVGHAVAWTVRRRGRGTFR